MEDGTTAWRQRRGSRASTASAQASVLRQRRGGVDDEHLGDVERARDNVGVAGYGVYLNGTRSRAAPHRSYTFSGLTCGTTYQVGVDAFDAARNRSGITSVLAATAPCRDATAPTAPANSAPVRLEPDRARESSGPSRPTTSASPVTASTATGARSRSRSRTPPGLGLVCRRGVLGLGRRVRRSGEPLSPRDRGRDDHSVRRHDPARAPRNLSVSGSTESAVSLAWQPAVDDRGVAEYRLSVNEVDMRTTTATTATFTGLACGRSYVVEVVQPTPPATSRRVRA